MRTRDFSAAPPIARAEALVIACGARSARGSAGFVWEHRGRDASGAVLVATFASIHDAARFAEASGHASARVFAADPDGYSNGVWRAEGDEMAHIPRFTRLRAEIERGRPGPEVRGGAAATPPARGGRRALGAAATGALFVGATRYRSPLSWLVLWREWTPMVRRMQRMRGYCWHAVYWEPPFTLGTIACFARRDDLLAMARGPEHRTLMQWVTAGRRWATGGYIRIHEAVT